MRFLHLDVYTIIARIAIILLILPLHEFAHGWAAKKCGDDTASLSGRLTLNPFAHVDPVGAILLLLPFLECFCFVFVSLVPVFRFSCIKLLYIMPEKLVKHGIRSL